MKYFHSILKTFFFLSQACLNLKFLCFLKIYFCVILLITTRFSYLKWYLDQWIFLASKDRPAVVNPLNLCDKIGYCSVVYGLNMMFREMSAYSIGKHVVCFITLFITTTTTITMPLSTLIRVRYMNPLLL